MDETHAADPVSVTYLGFWQQGPNGVDPQAEPKWQIRRVTVDNLITITEYANGSDAFDKVWANRAAYNYSLPK